MKSQPLRRSALVMLMGLALLTTGCVAKPGTQPTGSASAPTATTPSPTATAAEPADPDSGDCPAAPADAPAGTLDDPYRVGEQIVADCFSLVITELTADATHEVQATHPDEVPAEGTVFAVVKVMIARTGGEPADVSAIGIRYAASPGEQTDADPDLRLEEQQPPQGTLEPGQASGGTLVFEAPNSAAPAVVVTVDGGGEIWVTP